MDKCCLNWNRCRRRQLHHSSLQAITSNERERKRNIMYVHRRSMYFILIFFLFFFVFSPFVHEFAKLFGTDKTKNKNKREKCWKYFELLHSIATKKNASNKRGHQWIEIIRLNNRILIEQMWYAYVFFFSFACSLRFSIWAHLFWTKEFFLCVHWPDGRWSFAVNSLHRTLSMEKAFFYFIFSSLLQDKRKNNVL